MVRTAGLPGVALFLLASQYLPGTPALAGCDDKGSAWEAPNANYYCPSPGEGAPVPERGLIATFPNVFSLLLDKKPRVYYYVQMYSGQSRGGALQIEGQMAQRFRSTLGCCELELRRIDLGMLGPYWSIWAGPVKTKTLAVALCQRLRVEGLRACVVEPQ